MRTPKFLDMQMAATGQRYGTQVDVVAVSSRIGV
jgi:hypothetical protein